MIYVIKKDDKYVKAFELLTSDEIKLILTKKIHEALMYEDGNKAVSACQTVNGDIIGVMITPIHDVLKVMIKKVKTPELWYADRIGWTFKVRSLNEERYEIMGEEMMQILKEDCLIENETSFTRQDCCECEHFEKCKAHEDSDLQPMKCFRGDKFKKVQRG